MKNKMILTAILMITLLAMGAGMLGTGTGENTIPLSNEVVEDAGATAPYIVLQRWGDGVLTGTVYNTSTGAVTTTYADAAIRFAQNSVTGEWFATIPSVQPNADGYWGIIRDGADGAEAKSDTDIGRIFLSWDQDGKLRITKTDMFVSF